MITSQSISLKQKTQKPILIESNQQSINMVTNTITFIGQVNINYDYLNINADIVTINYAQKEKNKCKIIEGYGKPATFKQSSQNKNKLIYGKSLKICYKTSSNTLTLTGNAHIKLLNSEIKGNKINYVINKNYIEASNKPGKQVLTTLVIYT
ncbi:lipopolysaccharide transport periplasmic protein LptA [Blochmannia endosymbiont of Camponotus (Colobopsis) obliquus]|uniref:lipopolysaccharide transport periplasmic protein LptA n=1 Tax=Blochmannia endosymbiont of Camponotus (Colobopsis) obliquus TaxID=1505597 RepID=UPI00061ADD8C|nr:lipopolysaccharide transport periplasmic protein LptA [Blochmannia endosymbiont of Camponotus (Colobopsis) obliquus]